MGPLTLVVRAPVVAVVEAAGGDVKQQSRWGALACLLIVGAFGVWLAGLAADRGRPFWLQALIAGGVVFNPVTKATLNFGHPEEMVTAALATAAVICAVQRRPRAAGVLLGLAIAAKAWAILALPVVLFLLVPAQWRRAALAVVVSAGLLIAPMALGSPQRFRDNAGEVGRLGSQVGTTTPANLTWPFADVVGVTTTRGSGVAAKLPLAVARSARLLVFAAAFLLTLAWLRLGGRDRPETALLLLALILLVRGLFDPSNHSYYHAGPLLALLGYETLARRVFPFATTAFLVLFEVTGRVAGHVHSLDGLNRLYLAWALPFAAYMALELTALRASSASHAMTISGSGHTR
jgi:Glycosyltransferase family 87